VEEQRGRFLDHCDTGHWLQFQQLDWERGRILHGIDEPELNHDEGTDHRNGEFYSLTKERRKTLAITRAKPAKRSAVSTRTKPKPAAQLELRRAVPLDYVRTNEVDLRSTRDMAAPKLSGGSLGKGTVVAKIAIIEHFRNKPKSYTFEDVDQHRRRKRRVGNKALGADSFPAAATRGVA